MKIGTGLYQYNKGMLSNNYLITELNDQEAAHFFTGFAQEIRESWYIEINSHTEKSDEIKKWNAKINILLSLSKYQIKYLFPMSINMKCEALLMNNEKIAVTVWKKNPVSSGIYIDLLVSHPGVRGAGSLLIQHLVNVSLKKGSYGIITLRPTPGAVDAYQNIGFTWLDNNPASHQMVLFPWTSTKWQFSQHGWILIDSPA
ncbi:hypothetical protein ACGVWS_00870 [Enterobacteriaceae bacterium LUAb1]